MFSIKFIQYYIKIVLEAEFPPSAHCFTTMSHCSFKDPFLLERQGAYLLNPRGQGGVDIHASGIGLKKQKGNDQALAGIQTIRNSYLA